MATNPIELPTDDELMARVAAADEAALEDLVGRHRARVVALGLRALGDRGRAEDVAQETFLRVFRHAGRYAPRGRFSSWLLTIAARLCRNAVRDRARRAEGPLAEAHDRACLASPERHLELREALARLKLRYRLALVMKAVEGLSYREIAETLGCSEGEVGNAVFRARKSLARFLD